MEVEIKQEVILRVIAIILTVLGITVPVLLLILSLLVTYVKPISCNIV